MKTSFASRGLCSIMAHRALPSRSRKSYASNVWSEGLKSLRLRVGPWLNEAKRAVRRGEPDNSEIVIAHDLSVPLGVLKQHALRTARGQKIAYVVDAAYHDQNIDRIVALASGADQLFIEAPFLDADAEVAAERKHLTARQAGDIAKRAGVSSTSPPAIATREIGFEAKWNEPSTRSQHLDWRWAISRTEVSKLNSQLQKTGTS